MTEEQYTGAISWIKLVDGFIRRGPIPKIRVDTPFLCGEVEAVCLSNATYGLMIGNVPGARPANDPNPEWRDAYREVPMVVPIT